MNDDGIELTIRSDFQALIDRGNERRAVRVLIELTVATCSSLYLFDHPDAPWREEVLREYAAAHGYDVTERVAEGQSRFVVLETPHPLGIVTVGERE